MSFVREQVSVLSLPSEEFVVIGSGILDALGLRKANDLDIVASPSLFEKLKNSGVYAVEERYGSEMLVDGNLEVWQDWKSDATFEILKASAYEIEGVWFASPEIFLKRKHERGLPKDLADISLLEGFLNAKA